MCYMKHAAGRSQSTVKAKTLAQAKAVKKTKSAAKKTTGKVVINSRRKSPAQENKSALKNPARAAKSAAKTVTPKLSAKTLNALKTLSTRKTKLAAKQTAKPKTKKIALKTSAKVIKSSAQKSKPISPIKKIAAVKKQIKKIVAVQKTKPKTTTAKSKVSAKPIAKTPVKTAKSQSLKVAVRTTKAQKPKVKTTASLTKIKTVHQKAKPITAAKKPKNIKKPRPIVTAKPVQRKKIKPNVQVKKVNRPAKKIQPIAANKVAKKAAKAKPVIPIKKVGRLMQKLKPAISSATLRKPNPKIKKTAAVGKIKPVEKVIEATMPPKPKNRKARPISSAVFRGKKERYDFKVFALNEKFEPIPAVYIISKRKTDRHKRGHHALICIGETASISDELKRHRKGKCVKKHAANVVSILPEADEKMRLKIETDLKAAHAIPCVHV